MLIFWDNYAGPQTLFPCVEIIVRNIIIMSFELLCCVRELKCHSITIMKLFLQGESLGTRLNAGSYHRLHLIM